MAAELRFHEWSIAHPLYISEGESKPTDERVARRLCRDILQPNHDRDYRSLSMFLAPFLSARDQAIRVFDVLRSGIGGKALQINAIGGVSRGDENGFRRYSSIRRSHEVVTR